MNRYLKMLVAIGILKEKEALAFEREYDEKTLENHLMNGSLNEMRKELIGKKDIQQALGEWVLDDEGRKIRIDLEN